jgi:NAD(P)-dependent dehydrogenase (short-subunit alcohol dehydrogenase family)
MPKTILITGASRGIGRSAALLAGRRGWSVGVNYVSDEESAQSAVREIERAGGKAVALQGDVAFEADVIAIFDGAARALGSLDGVVVNAGVGAPRSRLADMSFDRMKRVFDVNVLGAYLCAREAARRLCKSSGGAGGSIVLISSAAARLGSPGEYVDYAGSKGAIDSLTLGLAKELGPNGVRVNAVRPGLIETDIHASGGEPDRARRLGATTPLGRPGLPEEIAEAIVWLLSDASSYATGAILDVTGGR